MKKNIVKLLSFLFVTVPVFVSAQVTPVEPPGETAQGSLPTVIMNIINYVLALVGIIALAYLIYGGFRYITSGGNETIIEQAKSTIISAIIGIVVIGVAAALVNFAIGAIGGGSAGAI